MCSEAGFHYRALFEYKKDRGDDISLQPGDILTVNKAALLTSDYQEGDERSPRGWLSGTNERTKDNGDFPGTYVEYVGPVNRTQFASGCKPRTMCSEAGFHYRALFEYKKDRGDDISLQPGDILTVNKAALLTSDYQEGDERSPRGWLSGTNERTKDNGDFPGTYVEYVGPVRVVPTNPKPRIRPVPPSPVGTSAPGPSLAGSSLGQADLPEPVTLPDQAPVVVMRITEALERQGAESESLYRSPPGSSCSVELQQALDADPTSVDLDQYDPPTMADVLKCYLQALPSPVIPAETYSELVYTAQDPTSVDLDQYDPPTMADALKCYLQALPLPVIPAEMYSELVYTAQEMQSVEECGQQLKRILESPSLPQQNRLVLQHLTRHWYKLSQNSSRTHLTPRQLGELFSELLFKPSLSSADVNPEHHVKIIEALTVAGGLAELQAAPDMVSSLFVEMGDCDKLAHGSWTVVPRLRDLG
ncbi:UNVERIFIED_CONTAM: hypothetical protein FKN15_050776 [Acipenser sinensis]